MAAATCNKAILVVEDDGDVRQSLCEVLEDRRFRAVCASNGAEALRQLRDGGELPCVILLDLMMPIMDGHAFRHAQQADPTLSSVPVVVLSAHADVTTIAGKIGAVGHLRKPVEIGRLMELVERYCQAS